MNEPIDILDQQDSLRRPFLLAASFHVFVVASFVGANWLLTHGREQFGNPDSLGGAIGITAVDSIPLPNRAGHLNPLANPTESHAPLPPPKPVPEKKAPKPEEDAIPIPSRTKPLKPAKENRPRQRYRPEPIDKPNQLYSQTGEALSSPMFGGISGASGVGVGQHSSLGTRFGAYEDLLRQRVSQHWRTGDVDPQLRTAPPVIVTFDLMRDGTVQNLQMLQRSGNSTLDFSAQRAILEASPFPPLPSAYQASSAHIEFWFQLKR
ncbi:MAG: energy transducer TonB [Bryobacteraceae bacterium]